MRLRSALVSLAAFLSLASISQGQSQTLFSENFESGVSNWTLSGTPQVLWHWAQPGECTSASISKMIAYNRAPAACNYNTGAGNSGQARTNLPIHFSGQWPFFISFDYIQQVGDPGDISSVRFINASTGQAALWTGPLIADGNLHTLPPSLIPSGIQAGEDYFLELRQTNNIVQNNALGWLVDNITITNSGPPPLPPSVSSVTPNHGDKTASTSVVITGANFTGATSLTFGGVSIPGFVVENSSTITATLPPTSLTGWVSVAVTTPIGTGTATSAYDYFTPPYDVGIACGNPGLGWSGGYPCLGQNYTLTTTGMGALKQVLLVDWSNINMQRHLLLPQAIGCPPPQCSLFIQIDQAINLGTSPSYTFSIANNPALIGVVLKAQSWLKGCPTLTSNGVGVVIQE